MPIYTGFVLLQPLEQAKGNCLRLFLITETNGLYMQSTIRSQK